MPKVLTGVTGFNTTITNFPLGSEVKNLAQLEAAFQKLLNNTITLKAVTDVAVTTSGAQTIGGVKTFSASPKIPDATNNDEPVSKGQLDAGLAGVTNPTTSGSATNGYRLSGDGWIEMWVETNSGDIVNDQEVTITFPHVLDDTKIIRVIPILEARVNNNTDAFCTVRTKSSTQCVIHIDEISALTQNFKLMTYISGYVP